MALCGSHARWVRCQRCTDLIGDGESDDASLYRNRLSWRWFQYEATKNLTLTLDEKLELGTRKSHLADAPSEPSEIDGAIVFYVRHTTIR